MANPAAPRLIAAGGLSRERPLPDRELLDSVALHEQLRLEARQRYEDSLNPKEGSIDWRDALTEAREMIGDALRASDFLCDLQGALTVSGRHMTVFRSLMAPPTSQDQFKLICSDWPKATEKSGNRIGPEQARLVAESLGEWLSPRLAPWLRYARRPRRRELYALMLATAPLIAAQRVATARRTRIAHVQEQTLIELLERNGWTKVASRTIDRQGALQPRQFMHKARFASGITGRAEVDVALGLRNAVVLALECKVTNDETNSVKRINDVSKKATAWRAHWGNFVQPAALLQGVIKMSDVQRLLDENVEVFWSHRLDLFGDWIAEQI
jgi:hypothetical protein